MDALLPAAVAAAAKWLHDHIWADEPGDDWLDTQALASGALEAAAPHLAAAPRCPTGCDDDCEQACHEAHKPGWKRDHDPEQCTAAIIAAAVAAEREACAQLAEQAGAMCPDPRPCEETNCAHEEIPFAALLRQGGESGATAR